MHTSSFGGLELHLRKKKINVKAILLYIAFLCLSGLLFAILYLILISTFSLVFSLFTSAIITVSAVIATLIARHLYLRTRKITLRRLRQYVETAKRVRTRYEPKKTKMMKENGLGWMPDNSRRRLLEKAMKIKDPQLRRQIIEREVSRDIWEFNLIKLKKEIELSGAKRVETQKRLMGDMGSYEIDLLIKTDDRTIPIIVKHRPIMPSDVEFVMYLYKDLKRTIGNLSLPYLVTKHKISSIVQKCAQEREVTLIKFRDFEDTQILKKSIGLFE